MAIFVLEQINDISLNFNGEIDLQVKWLLYAIKCNNLCACCVCRRLHHAFLRHAAQPKQHHRGPSGPMHSAAAPAPPSHLQPWLFVLVIILAGSRASTCKSKCSPAERGKRPLLMWYFCPEQQRQRAGHQRGREVVCLLARGWRQNAR